MSELYKYVFFVPKCWRHPVVKRKETNAVNTFSSLNLIFFSFSMLRKNKLVEKNNIILLLVSFSSVRVHISFCYIKKKLLLSYSSLHILLLLLLFLFFKLIHRNKKRIFYFSVYIFAYIFCILNFCFHLFSLDFLFQKTNTKPIENVCTSSSRCRASRR